MNNISRNVVRENSQEAIGLEGTYGNILSFNDVRDAKIGIKLSDSKDNSLRSNSLNDSNIGLYLRNSGGNTFENNTFGRNENGIELASSDGNRLAANRIVDNKLGLQVSSSQRNDILKNLVTNKDKGICLLHSHESNISGNRINNCREGIELVFSERNTIALNDIRHNYQGICLDEGVNPEKSNDNMIYINNFIDNDIDIHAFISANQWDSPDIIKYSYNRRSFRDHLGNYWDAYRGEDHDGDGIGDESYASATVEDLHPLIKPIENYGMKL